MAEKFNLRLPDGSKAHLLKAVLLQTKREGRVVSATELIIRALRIAELLPHD